MIFEEDGISNDIPASTLRELETALTHRLAEIRSPFIRKAIEDSVREMAIEKLHGSTESVATIVEQSVREIIKSLEVAPAAEEAPRATPQQAAAESAPVNMMKTGLAGHKTIKLNFSLSSEAVKDMASATLASRGVLPGPPPPPPPPEKTNKSFGGK
jgi:hypothetical protein